jgi:hypothetical protein
MAAGSSPAGGAAAGSARGAEPSPQDERDGEQPQGRCDERLAARRGEAALPVDGAGAVGAEARGRGSRSSRCRRRRRRRLTGAHRSRGRRRRRDGGDRRGRIGVVVEVPRPGDRQGDAHDEHDERRQRHQSDLLRQGRNLSCGAGDGSRTRAASLEGWSSTIELHPHCRRQPTARIRAACSPDLASGRGDLNPRPRGRACEGSMSTDPSRRRSRRGLFLASGRGDLSPRPRGRACEGSMSTDPSRRRSRRGLFLASGRGDLNPRPCAPKAHALPSCATPRDRPRIRRPGGPDRAGTLRSL